MAFPQSSASHRAWIRRIDWIVAALIAAIIVVIHYANMTHAGGLWRDETGAVNLARLPSFREIWSYIELESFPLLFTSLLRAWSVINPGNSDLAWRGFGLIVGLLVLAALWWNAWRFSSSPPLLSMLLFGLSPTAIRWGDELRGYGLGTFSILLALGLIWQVARSPSPRALAFAMVASIVAVQLLYQNAYLLVAICLGGVVVAMRRWNFRRALLVISAGIPAALSLLPYRAIIRREGEWNVTSAIHLDLPRIWLVLHRALADPSPLMFWLWVALLSAAIVAGCFLLIKWSRRPAHDEDKEIACFFLAVIVAVTMAYYIFLRLLSFPTETWYYLVWMGLIAVAVDVLVARAVRDGWGRIIRLAIVVVASIALLPGVWRDADVRMTNIDLVAQRLNQEVQKEDFILVHPWFCGVSFHRYYTGSADFTTLPPLADYRLQRFDFFKEQMRVEDPIQPVLEKVEATLRSGHVVWLVGYFPFSRPPRPPPKLPPAGEGPEGWRGAPYMMAYGMKVAYFLQFHIIDSAVLKVPVTQPVNPFENLPVTAVSGWRF